MEENEEIKEAYWFVRWCQVRYKLKKAEQALEEIKDSEISVLRLENIRLKNDLTNIRRDYVPAPKPVKRTYKGNNPNKQKP